MAILDCHAAWKAIESYRPKRLSELFQGDAQRVGQMSRDVASIHFDWSKTHLDEELLGAFAVLAYGVEYLRNEWKSLDKSVGADIAFLEGKLKGDIGVTSQTLDNSKWTVAVDPVTSPSSVWLFDRKTKALTKLYTGRPALEGMPLAAMHPVEIKSRDGLTLTSYLTLPPGTDADGDGKPNAPVPLVLLVVLTLAGRPMAADAAQPEIVPFSETGSGPIDCGSVVLTSFSEITGMTTTYFDAAGTAIRFRFQETVDQTVTNPVTGASISFTQSWVEQDDLVAGTRTISGRIMTGANTGKGVILQDAGRVLQQSERALLLEDVAAEVRQVDRGVRQVPARIPADLAEGLACLLVLPLAQSLPARVHVLVRRG